MINKLLQGIYIFVLFIILTPGILINLPKSKYISPIIRTLIHAFLFAIIWMLTNRYIKEGLDKQKPQRQKQQRQKQQQQRRQQHEPVKNANNNVTNKVATFAPTIPPIILPIIPPIILPTIPPIIYP